MQDLEQEIRRLTTPINGQFPRPWMSTTNYPSQALVFIVGYNPAKAYRVEAVEHDRHIDALFNRNGETCRGLYSELTSESPTRGNIEMLTAKLNAVGIDSVLETNVICYATANKEDLAQPDHEGGRARGREIFSTLLQLIIPKAIIIHGSGVRDEFNRAFKNKEPKLPGPPNAPGAFPQIRLSTGTQAFVIPSLALPGYQNWPHGNSFCNWAEAYLSELAVRVAQACAA